MTLHQYISFAKLAFIAAVLGVWLYRRFRRPRMKRGEIAPASVLKASTL